MNAEGAGPPTPEEFAQARSIVQTSGVLAPLRGRLDSGTGRPRSLSVEGLLVAMQINALRKNHRGAIIDIARVLNSCASHQLESLGVRNWDPTEAYDRTDRLFNKLSKALESGWDESVSGAAAHIDETWFANQMATSPLDGTTRSRSIAVDGTDIETWGRFRGRLTDEEIEAAPDQRDDDGSGKAAKRGRARVLYVGPDGRPVYTADPDARGGHRSATSSREAGTFVGYELHLGVDVKEVAWSNGIDEVRFGDDQPPVITCLTLVPAGSHRAEAIVPQLVAAKAAGHPIEEVIWDRGYSYLREETTVYPLLAAGIEQTFRPMRHQRPLRPGPDGAVIIDGQLFSDHLPAGTRGQLPMPPMGASDKDLLEHEAAFNQRARYRYQRHTTPDSDGVSRWKCPFHAGFLRSRALPRTMRHARSAPLVHLPDGATCCSGIVSIKASDLPWAQRLTAGTTAWRKSMGRRQVVEGANAGLKGEFVNIERKFLRVFGRVKIAVLLAFTIAGYNTYRLRSFAARKQAEADTPKRRRRRRTGTLGDLLGASGARPGRDPPLA